MNILCFSHVKSLVDQKKTQTLLLCHVFKCKDCRVGSATQSKIFQGKRKKERNLEKLVKIICLLTLQ